MTEDLKLAQMKAAVREALPRGAGDVTVTDVAKAALKVAEQWERAALSANPPAEVSKHADFLRWRGRFNPFDVPDWEPDA